MVVKLFAETSVLMWYKFVIPSFLSPILRTYFYGIMLAMVRQIVIDVFCYFILVFYTAMP